MSTKPLTAVCHSVIHQWVKDIKLDQSVFPQTAAVSRQSELCDHSLNHEAAVKVSAGPISL